MTAVETWLLVAVIVAGVAAVLRFAAPVSPLVDRLGTALGPAAVGVVAVALLIAL